MTGDSMLVSSSVFVCFELFLLLLAAAFLEFFLELLLALFFRPLLPPLELLFARCFPLAFLLSLEALVCLTPVETEETEPGMRARSGVESSGMAGL